MERTSSPSAPLNSRLISEKRRHKRVQPNYHLILEDTIFEFQSPEMDPDGMSITIDVWQSRRARLEALATLKGTHLGAGSKCRTYLLLRPNVEEGNVDKFLKALENYSSENSVSLSDIIDAQGPSGSSLLHVAAGIENADILRVLLMVIPDERLPTKVNNRGDTALHVAARAGRIHAAKLLVEVGSIVDKLNDTGNTALHEAVKNRHFQLTDLILSRSSRLVYMKNMQGKSPLYLAVETEDLNVLRLLMEAVKEHEPLPSQESEMEGDELVSSQASETEGISPVHGAVMRRRLDMLKMMKEKKKLFDLTDARDGTPLHLAAYGNFIEELKFLVKEFASSAFEWDKEGYLPIHVACRMGHLETIKELLRHCPHPEELLTSDEGQNILHIAAKYGRVSVVKYILGEAKYEKLINAKDKKENTPLHVATFQWQPEVLFFLTRDNRVDLKVVNNDNLTAFDIVDEQLREFDAPLRKSLTRIILVSAKVPRSKDIVICQPKGLSPERDLKPPQMDRLKDTAEIRMVVATLIATMTFAAGFSVPGGYNGSEPNAGIAVLLNKPMYDVFVICNTVAMYSSIIAVVILLWTQINDLHAVHRAIRNARLPLLIALATMSIAFMAGVYVTISERTWIAIVTLIVGITALIIILILYIALFIPLWYNYRPLQLFADHIIKAAISISKSVTGGRAIRAACFDKPDDYTGEISSGRWAIPAACVPVSYVSEIPFESGEISSGRRAIPAACVPSSDVSEIPSELRRNH